jgi:hypothetical protein
MTRIRARTNTTYIIRTTARRRRQRSCLARVVFITAAMRRKNAFSIAIPSPIAIIKKTPLTCRRAIGSTCPFRETNN